MENNLQASDSSLLSANIKNPLLICFEPTLDLFTDFSSSLNFEFGVRNSNSKVRPQNRTVAESQKVLELHKFLNSANLRVNKFDILFRRVGLESYLHEILSAETTKSKSMPN